MNRRCTDPQDADYAEFQRRADEALPGLGIGLAVIFVVGVFSFCVYAVLLLAGLA